MKRLYKFNLDENDRKLSSIVTHLQTIDDTMMRSLKVYRNCSLIVETSVDRYSIVLVNEKEFFFRLTDRQSYAIDKHGQMRTTTIDRHIFGRISSYDMLICTRLTFEIEDTHVRRFFSMKNL